MTNLPSLPPEAKTQLSAIVGRAWGDLDELINLIDVQDLAYILSFGSFVLLIDARAQLEPIDLSLYGIISGYAVYDKRFTYLYSIENTYYGAAPEDQECIERAANGDYLHIEFDTPTEPVVGLLWIINDFSERVRRSLLNKWASEYKKARAPLQRITELYFSTNTLGEEYKEITAYFLVGYPNTSAVTVSTIINHPDVQVVTVSKGEYLPIYATMPGLLVLLGITQVGDARPLAMVNGIRHNGGIYAIVPPASILTSLQPIYTYVDAGVTIQESGTSSNIITTSPKERELISITNSSQPTQSSVQIEPIQTANIVTVSPPTSTGVLTVNCDPILYDDAARAITAVSISSSTSRVSIDTIVRPPDTEEVYVTARATCDVSCSVKSYLKIPYGFNVASISNIVQVLNVSATCSAVRWRVLSNNVTPSASASVSMGFTSPPEIAGTTHLWPSSTPGLGSSPTLNQTIYELEPIESDSLVSSSESISSLVVAQHNAPMELEGVVSSTGGAVNVTHEVKSLFKSTLNTFTTTQTVNPQCSYHIEQMTRVFLPLTKHTSTISASATTGTQSAQP